MALLATMVTVGREEVGDVATAEPAKEERTEAGNDATKAVMVTDGCKETKRS